MSAPTALSFALELAAAGYHLAPVTIRRNPATGRKMPTYHGKWRELSTTDPDVIRDWAAQYGPDLSFCIDCAASGIVVVDLDVKPDGSVDAVRWWGMEGLPAGSMVVNTPTGGMHLYYRAGPQPIGNSTGAIAEGVDVRGDGGHVYAPGSRVVGDREVYALLADIVPAAQLDITPGAVLERIPQSARRVRDRQQARANGAVHDREWVENTLREQMERVYTHSARAGSGFRGVLMGAAMVYGRAVAAGLRTRDEAEQKLLRAAAAVWGRADEDDAAWITCGLDDGEADPWTVVVTQAEARELHRMFEAASAPQSPTPTPGAPSTEQQRGRLNLPAEFWDARPSLKHIRDAALSCWACPDAVFGVALARMSAFAHPSDRLDLGIGRPSPLTLFAIPYGPPSAGKGIAVSTAADLLPVPAHLQRDQGDGPAYRERPLGTGEGLTESYFGMATETEVNGDKERKVKVRKQLRTNILFVMDEGESLVKLAGRNGSTIATTIRRAWSGELLGEANASIDRDRQLDRNTYSIGLVVSFQPATIGPLFDPNEIGGGTPHRFIYMAADDDTLPDEPPEDLPAWPGPLELPERKDPELLVQWHNATPLTFRLVDPDVRREIQLARWRGLNRSREVDELDGHITLMRGRIAAHLAHLDGRTDITGEDWRLAGMVVEVSGRVRDAAIAYGEGQRREAARREDERKIRVGTEIEAAKLVVQESAETQRIARGAAVLARKVLKAAPVDGLATGALRDAAGRYKRDIAACLEHAVAAGWLITVDAKQGGTRYKVGPSVNDVPPA